MPIGLAPRIATSAPRTLSAGSPKAAHGAGSRAKARKLFRRYPKAADFIKRGVEKGPALGAAMRAAAEAWIKARFPGDPAIVQDLAAAIVRAAVGQKRKAPGAMPAALKSAMVLGRI